MVLLLLLVGLLPQLASADWFDGNTYFIPNGTDTWYNFSGNLSFVNITDSVGSYSHATYFEGLEGYPSDFIVGNHSDTIINVSSSDRVNVTFYTYNVNYTMFDLSGSDPVMVTLKMSPDTKYDIIRDGSLLGSLSPIHTDSSGYMRFNTTLSEHEYVVTTTGNKSPDITYWWNSVSGESDSLTVGKGSTVYFDVRTDRVADFIWSGAREDTDEDYKSTASQTFEGTGSTSVTVYAENEYGKSSNLKFDIQVTEEDEGVPDEDGGAPPSNGDEDTGVIPPSEEEYPWIWVGTIISVVVIGIIVLFSKKC